MKKLLLPFIFLSAIFGLSNVSAQTYLINDDFESYTLNTFPSAAGWVLLHNGVGNSYQIVTNTPQACSGTKFMQLLGSKSLWWAAHMYKAIPFIPCLVYAEAKVKASASGTGLSEDYGQIIFYNYSTLDELAKIFFDADAGNIKCAMGTVSQTIMPFNANQCYKVKMKFDYTNKSMDVWVDDILKVSNMIGTLPAAPYNCLEIGAEHGNTTFFYDDVKVWYDAGTFQPTDTTFCSETGGCIDFSDHSSGAPTAWHWLFPGANPNSSNLQNPTGICYYTPGTYPVTLIVTSACGTDTLVHSPCVIVGGTPTLPIITQTGNTLTSSHASSYQWYFNGSPIPGATDSFYVATQYGLYAVNITDSIGCSRISNGVLASVSQLSDQSLIKIYPNPSHDYLILKNTSSVKNITLQITNALGQVVYAEKLKGEIEKRINLNLSGGIYFIQLNDGARIYSQKLVIQ
jgi:hypothetical protein